MAKKVNIKELARRYTTAVFDLAKSQNKLDRVEKDLEALKSMLTSEPRLQKVISARTLNGEAQVEFVKEMGKGFDPLTINFLLIVARNSRLQYLGDIIDAFQHQISEEKGELKAEIITAQKLEDKQVAGIVKDLSAKTGKKVIVDQIVKPEIIGGLIVKIGPKMYDYSVKSRLFKLKTKLLSA